MGSAIVTAVPADTVNFAMAAKYLGMDMGRLVQRTFEAFLVDSPHLREEAERLGIAAHSGIDAAIGTKRFQDQILGEKLMKRMADLRESSDLEADADVVLFIDRESCASSRALSTNLVIPTPSSASSTLSIRPISSLRRPESGLMLQ